MGVRRTAEERRGAPLTGWRKIAVIGPNADRARAMFGCYFLTNHVLDHHPDVPFGFAVHRARSAALGGD
jgi:beta-xylosidase